jgi:hypothetical protein
VAPGVFILGNKDGYYWLSEHLAWFAGQVSEGDSFNAQDPDNHEHIDDKPWSTSDYPMTSGSWSERSLRGNGVAY